MLHNQNRPLPGGNAFEIMKANLKRLQKLGGQPAALQTTTKNSLTKYREIVDTYLELGFKSIFVRPLTPLGYAQDNWARIGYSAEEFVQFYRQVFQYILQCGKQGKLIAEGHATIFLSKILKHQAVNFMELRSPCGGALGQLAYYYNGDIYTCDEARMLAEMGDQTFRLGNVYQDTYQEIMDRPICENLCKASCLESLPRCSHCVYSTYCGVCPVINWSVDKTLFPQMASNFRCKVYEGILDVLFETLYNADEETLQCLQGMTY